MRRTCVVFDLDDTLYLERDYVRSGFAAVGQWMMRTLGIPDFEDHAWQLFQEGERSSTFQAVLVNTFGESDPRLLSEMIDIYRSHRPNIHLLPDSIHCLTELCGNVAVGLITDGDLDRQQRKCEALEISKWCQRIVYTGAWGSSFYKPHPRSYESLQSALGVDRYRFVYVADNPQKDFTTPLAFGWDTIRVRRP
jgi:putative hydrolase of the HAD superfamily